MLEKLLDRTIENSGGCLEWQGALDPNGYGAVRFCGRKVGAHRAVASLLLGGIPKGLHICHHCDNRRCLNPKHLFIGTRKHNMQDCVRKGRIKNGSSPKPLIHGTSNAYGPKKCRCDKCKEWRRLAYIEEVKQPENTCLYTSFIQV